MFGAFIWAVLAYFTMYEFSIVAWGLGGLAGLGMALGYEADDGTFAGIIAAFMSLLGIIAAKVFIVVIFIAAIVSSAVSEMEIEPAADAAAIQADDPVEMQRSMLAMALAMKDLEASGESVSDAGDERWTAAMSKARAEVASLTPEEIETRINELGKQHGLDGKVEDFDGDGELGDEEALADDEEDFDAEDAEAGNDELEDEDVTFGAVVGSLVRPNGRPVQPARLLHRLQSRQRRSHGLISEKSASKKGSLGGPSAEAARISRWCVRRCLHAVPASIRPGAANASSSVDGSGTGKNLYMIPPTPLAGVFVTSAYNSPCPS